MSEAATEVENYSKHKVVSGDTMWDIVQDRYNIANNELVIALANYNNLDVEIRRGNIHVNLQLDSTLKIPNHLMYNTRTLSSTVDNLEIPITELQVQPQVKRVEFHYKEDDSLFKEETLMSRRFVYYWKKNYPNRMYEEIYHNDLYSKVTGDNKSTLDEYYQRDTEYPYRHFVLKKNNLSVDDKKKLYEAYKEAKFSDAWVNGGILMTDDWGQPWDIQGYIDLCAEKQRFEYIEVPNTLFDSGDTFGQVISTGRDFQLSKNQNFAFYSPKQINEVRFIDVRELFGMFGTDRSILLDKRVYFQPGDEYAFMCAPLDVIWARDEVMDIHSFATSSTDLEALARNGYDYEKDIKEILHIDDIYEYPPTYKSNFKHDIYKLIEDKEIQVIGFNSSGGLEPTEGKFCESCYKIELEPNFQEYISLLNKANYDLHKGLNINNRSLRKNMALSMGLNQVRDYVNILENCSIKEDLTDLNISNLKKHKEAITNLIQTVSDSANIDKQSKPVISEIPGSEQTTEIMDPINIIKGIKPYEFTENNLEKRFNKVIEIIENDTFKDYLSKYFTIENYRDNDNTKYFGFRHPLLKPLHIITDSFDMIKDFPDTEVVNSIYSDHIIEFENTLLNIYDTHEIMDEYHDEIMAPVLETLLSIKLTEETDSNSEERDLIDIEDLRKIFNDIKDKTPTQISSTPTATGNVLATITNFLMDENVTGFWNDQDGPSCTLDKLISSYQGIRLMQRIGTEGAYHIAGMELKLTQLTKAFSLRVQNKLHKHALNIQETQILTLAKPAYTARLYNMFQRGRTTALQLASRLSSKINIRIDQIRQNLSNRRSRLDSSVNRLRVDAEQFESKVKTFRFSKITQGAVIVTSGFQLASSIIAINNFIQNAGEDGEISEEEWSQLISAIANGGLALTGLPIEKFISIIATNGGKLLNGVFGRNVDIEKFKFKPDGVISVAGKVIAIPAAIISLKNATFNFALADLKGDMDDEIFAIVEIVLAVNGIGVFLFQLLRWKAGMAISSTLGTIGFWIILLIQLYKAIIKELRRGGISTLESIVDQLLTINFNPLKNGYWYYDLSEIYSLGSMWRLEEGVKEKYPAIDEAIHKLTRHKIEIDPLELHINTFVIDKEDGSTETIEVFNIDKIKSAQLDYCYSVPALKFKGYSDEAIKQIHKDGVFTHLNEDQELINMKVDYLIEFWNFEANKDYISIMEYIIEHRYEFPTEDGKSLDKDFWYSTYIGLQTIDEQYRLITRVRALDNNDYDAIFQLEQTGGVPVSRAEKIKEREEIISKLMNSPYNMDDDQINDI